MLVLLMHYAPTYLTLEGENAKRFPDMGSRSFEEILESRRPDLVLHGHTHGGKLEAEILKRQMSLIDFSSTKKKVPVFNFALPLVEGVTIIDVERREDEFHITRS